MIHLGQQQKWVGLGKGLFRNVPRLQKNEEFIELSGSQAGTPLVEPHCQRCQPLSADRGKFLPGGYLREDQGRVPCPKITHELKATRESMGRDKSLLIKCFVFV